MKKLSLLLIAGLFIFTSQTLNAQINVSGAFKRASKEIKKSSDKKEADKKAQAEQTEKDELDEKDYPLVTRVEGSVIKYHKETKWDEYKLPINLNDSYFNWEAPAKFEGKIIRIQYSISPDNNPAYLLKVYKSSLVKDGFEIIMAKNQSDIAMSSGTFTSKYYSSLGNGKFGFAYKTAGKDHCFIVAKINKDGEDIFAAIYISAFDNTTLITQDIIEAETFEQEKVIATPFRGSTVGYDDKLGYGEFYVCTGTTIEEKAEIKKIEGYVRNRFCSVPTGRSPLEIVRNYEEAITNSGGRVLMVGKSKECIDAFMKVNGHPNHGLTNYNYMMFPRGAYQYFCGIIPSDEVDYFVVVVAGKVEQSVFYHLVTIETKAMEMDMVSAENISESMLAEGHIAIYDIHFETGQSEINQRSAIALKNIAEFLNSQTEKKYLIVGHTDNVGDFDANIQLSTERANAIVNELITKYGVNKDLLKPTGAGSMSPVATNSTDEGKAKNRRVEIVEQ